MSRPLVLLACAVVLAAAPSRAEEFDYRLELNGQRAGTEHESRRHTPQGWVTDSESTIRLQRLDTPLEIREHAHSEEDAAGHLRRYVFRVTAGASTSEVEATVAGDELAVRDRPGASPHRQRLDGALGPLLGPQGAQRATRDWLRNPTDALRLLELTDDGARPHLLVRRFLGVGDAPNHYRLEESSDDGDPSTLVVDDTGELLTVREPSPLGVLELFRVDTADAPADTPAPAPSIDAAISRRADRRLPFPREIDALTLTVTFTGPPPADGALDGPGQRLLHSSDGRWRLRVDQRIDEPPAAPSRAALEPNALFDSDDPAIRRLAASLRARGADASTTVNTLRAAVAERLRFDAGFTFAPASTVLTTGRGSCVGYATLTAALARALGHPSRIVYGIAYANGAWVGHAWAEVYLAEQWHAVDAALWSPATVDATHIALARSDGSEGLSQGLTELARLFGRLTLGIEAYQVHGVTHEVARTPLASVDRAGVYRDPGLGLRVRPPPGYRDYQDLAAHYPDATVCTVQSADGRYRLEQLTGLPPSLDARAVLRARYGQAALARGTLRTDPTGRLTLRLPGVSVAVVPRGSEWWVLTGTGAAASDADLASRLELDPEPAP